MLLQDIFFATAAQHGARTAIEVPPGSGRAQRSVLRYDEAAAAVRALAARLAPLVGVGDIVALHLPRTSPLLYLAQLAVLEAGGAFTCLDPAFPAERVAEILDDADPVVRIDPDPASPDGAAITVRRAPSAGSAGPTPDSLAYVIYTSGTTGRPKGVMIAHRSLVNLIESDRVHFGLGPDDRVVQGSSAAYDSSLEEIWLAFAAGATLLVMDDAAARLGPDLVGWLAAERASVFCPPPTLLRATGCRDPQAALPDLRLLYVGGEALDAEIAALWSRGRRMVNGYGPTECTVTCLRADVRAGEPVSIGVPVSGMAAWALGDALEPVPPGTPGELCLGGVGLALGYRGSPELTAEKFVDHPGLGRIYRSGDLVTQNAGGAFHYHGRIDAQVKLRGYRIELGEIEARLAALPGVRAAACRVQGEAGAAQLAAHVVPLDPASPPDPEELRRGLSAVLPPYMVPALIAPIAALPTTIGGKLDRRALPELSPGAAGAAAEAAVAPRSPLEAKIAAAAAAALGQAAPVSVVADFFALGGDSLSAAMLVTALRDDPETARAAVSDIYETRTVAALADRLAAGGASAGETEPPPAGIRPGQRPALVTLLQAGWLWLLLSLASFGGWLTAFVIFPAVFGRLGTAAFVLLAPLLGAALLGAYTLLMALAVIGLKRMLIGRYAPRRDPVWSLWYLRCWVVQQTARLLPWRMLAGTQAQIALLRALGARIGDRVHIHRGVVLWRGGWDLLTIEDDAAIGQEALLQLAELDRGDLVFAPIRIGRGACLETRAGMRGGSAIGAGAGLTALSSLDCGCEIPDGERWDGVPAAPAGTMPPPPQPEGAAALAPRAWDRRLLGAEAAVSLLAALPAELALLGGLWLAGVGADRFFAWLYHPDGDALLWAVLIATTVLALPVALAWTALLSRALGPVRPGVIPRWSGSYIRVWLKTSLLNTASDWLSGTLFWPHWLRLAGMRIGPGSEISTIIDVVPELVSIGGGTFFADGIYLGGPQIRGGTVSLAPTAIGAETFLGNHAVIRGGDALPDRILIGISTPADAARIHADSSWFGHPSLELPRREVVEVDRALTHEPSLIRYIDRLFWESLRFAIPLGPLVAGIGWFALVGALARRVGAGAAFFAAALPLATLLSGAALCAALLALKWLLLGRVRPGQHPLWSCWCSRWDFLYVVWGKWARHLLEPLEGTLLLNAYLRLIGMRIGRRVVLGPGFAQVVDPDMLHIADDATVNTIFQAHTFEDRVLKIDHVHIGRSASLGAATVQLYGSAVGEGAWVAPHSVLMKQEHLLPRRRYAGAPAREG